MLTVVAPAKVNLHLAVGGLRPDGYHDVTTVMHALELHDSVHISPAERLSATCVPEVGVRQEENLAFRAAVAMGEAFDRDVRLAIRVTKRIPHGAGLGGGSTDAAAVIAAIARLWDISRTSRRCLDVAASLGADVPFFLLPGGCALMTGRGDMLDSELPGLDGASVVIVHPGVRVSTPAAYRAFDAEPATARDSAALIDAVRRHDQRVLAEALENNLASAACAVEPVVGEVRTWLAQEQGVLGAQVSGSGSAVFALCETPGIAQAIAGRAAAKGWWSSATRLRAAGVEVEQGGGAE